MGCGLTSSITSEKSLPRTPPVWKPNASAPANGPSPTARIKISAQNSSGMERSKLSPKVLPQYGMARSRRALGLSLLSPAASMPPSTVRLEMIPSGKAIHTAKTVPMRDRAMVSTPLQRVLRMNLQERSGGKRPLTKVAIWCHASPCKNTRRSVPVPVALHMISPAIQAKIAQEYKRRASRWGRCDRVGFAGPQVEMSRSGFIFDPTAFALRRAQAEQQRKCSCRACRTHEREGMQAAPGSCIA